MRFQQNCSKQEERQYWTECPVEYVWYLGNWFVARAIMDVLHIHPTSQEM